MKHLYAAASLIEEASLGEIGVDLYVGTLPADVKKGVMLRDPLYGATIDHGMKDFFDHNFIVIVRDPDPAAGYDRAAQISRVLEIHRREFAGVYITRMIAAALPVTYPKGDADDVETSVRINVSFGLLP